MFVQFLYSSTTLAGGRPLLPTDISSSKNQPSTRSETGKTTSKKPFRGDGFLSSVAQVISRSAHVLDSLKEELQTFTFSTTTPIEQELEDRIKLLRLTLKTVTTLEDYRRAASELDKLEGNEIWKNEVESPEYNYKLIQSRLLQLEDAQTSGDAARILFLIRTSLTRNLGGMGNLKLYKHSRVGTKKLTERYIASALSAVRALLDITLTQNNALNPRHVLDQILQARQAFGRSALLLSGGGTLGMNHIGVIKTLWETDLLPRIVSGTSAGSIVGSVLCTRTDDELSTVIGEMCCGDLAVFVGPSEDEGAVAQIARFLKLGAVFDISNLTRVMKNLLGDMTFQEGYNRTRRILNICVSSSGVFELPRLLNYVTAPNVIIWSAVAASCSVPLVFNSCPLLAKDPRTGHARPWNESPHRWIDGSVDNDIPMTRLAEMFNVNHFIVSQVNPHVVPFLDKEEEGSVPTEPLTPGVMTPTEDNWFRKTASFAKDEAMHRLDVLAELGILPNLLTKARSMLSQRYSGHITILPCLSYAELPKILKNPTEDFMTRAVLRGERATWPKLDRIQNHVAIELALDDAVQQLRTRIAFSPSQVDLRINTMTKPSPRTRRQGFMDGSFKRRKSSVEADGIHKPQSFKTKLVQSNSSAKVSDRQNHRSLPVEGLRVNTPPVSHATRQPYTGAQTSEGDFFLHSSDSSDDEQPESPVHQSHALPSFRLLPSPELPARLFPHASQPVTPVQSRGNGTSSYFHKGPPSPIMLSSLTNSSLSMTKLYPQNTHQSSFKPRGIQSPAPIPSRPSSTEIQLDSLNSTKHTMDTYFRRPSSDSKLGHNSSPSAVTVSSSQLDESDTGRMHLRKKSN